MIASIGGLAIVYKFLSSSTQDKETEAHHFQFKSLGEYKKLISGYRTLKKERLLKENKKFFDSVFKYPLTLEQRIAVISESNSSLILASAGSGKTSTNMLAV